MAEEFIPLDNTEEEFIPLEEPVAEKGGIIENVKGFIPSTETAMDTFIAAGRGFNPLADEIGAGIMSLMDKNLSYTEAKKIYDTDYERRKARTPTGTTVGNIAGALALPMPGTSTKVIAKEAPRVAKFLGMASNLVKKQMVGGGFGAAYAASEGDTAEERIQRALWGGAFGAAGATLAGPISNVAEKTAVKAIAASEMAVEKMAAYVPGGAKKIGRWLLDESLMSPVTGLKGTLRKIDKVQPKVQQQYDNLLVMASENGGRINMVDDVFKQVKQDIIDPLRGGDSIIERKLADDIEKFLPGWAEKPIRTLKEANDARVKLDDVLADTFLRNKQAKIMGGKGALSDRKLAEVRYTFNEILDNKIDDAIAGVAGAGAQGKWYQTKATYQMLMEAKQAAIQKLGKKSGARIRDVVLATVMPFNRYSAALAATGVGSSLLYGRGGAAIASGLNTASKIAPRAGQAVPTGATKPVAVEEEFIPLDQLQE